jgi:phosphoribosylformimino-5-aminoimidazole carboxamide ribotide isomerase
MEGGSKPSGTNFKGSWLGGFTIFPAIDLRGGRCVRLKQGDFGRSKEYDADPVERAREWERRGAQAIHVVDLDGAREGRPVQLDLLREIASSVEVPLQVGGGVRTLEDLRAVRGVGASRVVIGTAAVGDRNLRLRAVDELGPELVVAVDARDGIVATHGWQSSSGIALLELSEELAADGVGAVLYTDVSRDGMDAGVALEQTAAVARLVPTIASGGVRGEEDVVALSKISGVLGVVVGTALYEGRATLEELLRAAGGRGEPSARRG